jgi:hypothetical protein
MIPDLLPELSASLEDPLKACVLVGQAQFARAIEELLDKACKLADAQADPPRTRSIIITVRNAERPVLDSFPTVSTKLSEVVRQHAARWQLDHIWHAADPQLPLVQFFYTIDGGRISPSYHPFVIARAEQAPPFSCAFVEGIGMVVALSGDTPEAGDDHALGIAIDFAGRSQEDSAALAALLHRIFHLPDPLAPQDSAVLRPIMQMYNLSRREDATDFWSTVIQATRTAPLWNIAVEMPFAAFDLARDGDELQRFLAFLEEAHRQNDRLEAPPSLEFYDAELLRLVTDAAPQEVREIFCPAYLEKEVSAALQNGHKAYIAALSVALHAILRRLTSADDQTYLCGLSDRIDHNVLVVAPESGEHDSGFSLFVRLFNQGQRAGIAIPAMAETEPIKQTFAARFQATWDEIPSFRRSDTPEGRRAITTWLERMLDRMQPRIEIESAAAQATRGELAMIARDGILFKLDSTGVYHGSHIVTLIARSHRPIRFAGPHPTSVMSEPALALAMRREFLNALPPDQRADSARILREEHECQRQAIYAHQTASLPLLELWNRSAAQQFFIGSLGSGHLPLPQAPLQQLALDILLRLKVDSGYEVRLTDTALDDAFWLCEDPDICAIYKRDRSVRTWGRITSEPAEVGERKAAFERLWQEAAIGDSGRASRFILEAASLAQPVTLDRMASFLDRALAVAGLPAEPFTAEIAGVEARSGAFDRFDIFLDSVPQTWFPARLLSQEAIIGKEVAYGRAKLKRAARFEEMLAKQRAPLRLLSQRVPFERWMRQASDEYIDYFDYLLSLPFIEWRITTEQSPVLYELISNSTLLIERHPDNPSRAFSSEGIGWATTNASLISSFAQHFNSLWQKAMNTPRARDHFHALIQSRPARP